MSILNKILGVGTTIKDMKPLTDAVTELAEAANRNAPVAGPGHRLMTIPGGGTSHSAPTPFQAVQWKLGVVKTAGPSSESDYTDNRYWVKAAFILQGATDAPTVLASPTEEDMTNAEWVTVTNLTEDANNSHLLLPGSFVWYRKILSRSSTGKSPTMYVMSTGGLGGTVSGKVTGNASGAGKYVGKSFTDATSDVSPSGDLAEADFGTLSSTVNCLILNPPELGSSNTGHDVTAGTNTSQFSLYFTGRLASINSDGTKVIHAQMFWAGC